MIKQENIISYDDINFEIIKNLRGFPSNLNI